MTSDAVSMYTYINTDHAMSTIGNWMRQNGARLPPTFPTDIVLELLEIVMRNNVFVFGDLFYHQKSGTAMGTSVAPIYSTIYYGIHEEFLLEKYKNALIYYRRYIDDVFMIWQPQRNADISTSTLATDMNYGTLQWEQNTPSNEVIFLDLRIHLDQRNHITTSTYHKPLNLHLYIPPASAHPPGVLYGLIAGAVRRFWLQNTRVSDFQRNITFLFLKLRERGHDPAILSDLFQKASSQFATKNGNAKRFIKSGQSVHHNKRTLYFHQQFHPRGVRRHLLHEAYHASIGLLHFYDRQIVCYSRPKNLRDLIVPSTLSDVPGHNPSTIVGQLA